VELNVLVIDDSAYARTALRGVIESIDGLRASVSTAVDGLDGYRQAIRNEPDLIMLDLEMPEMDGYTFLRLIKGASVPVIVVSGCATGRQGLSKAIELGATACVEKPSRLTPDRLSSIRGEIADKVRAIRFASPRHTETRPRFKATDIGLGVPEAVVIGASTGGPRAVAALVKNLPSGLPTAFVVVMHMPPWLTASFTERLNNESLIPVKVASDGAVVQKTQVLVVPGGRHISFYRTGQGVHTRLSTPDSTDQQTPSIDLAFSSASAAWGAGLVGVVMTGMGEDGSKGIVNIKEKGGLVLAESRESAVVCSMPEAAVATGKVDRVLSSRDIGEWIAGIYGGNAAKLA